MGIPIQLAYLLAKENERSPFSGRVLQLGRQACLFSADALSRYAAAHRLRIAPATPPFGDLDDIQFFSRLGFNDVLSCDVSDYQAPSFVVDLNSSSDGYPIQCDVVFDGGTIEHVFHLPNALSQLHHMTRSGGRIVHFAACSNNVDHGFYMFSPTLFYDYYTENGYLINTFTICELTVSHNFKFLKPWNLYRYEPGTLDRLMHGGFAAKTYCLYVVVTKTENSSCGKIPQQRLYSKSIWPSGSTRSRPTPPSPSLLIRAKNVLRDNCPTVYAYMMDLYWRAFRRIPNFIGTIPSS